jgi:hypothetical protein
MSHIFQWLRRPLTAQVFDVKVGQIACWLVSALVLVLGILKLCRLPLNETEMFLGVLLVLAVGLLCVVLGVVLPLAARGTTSDLTNRST